MIKHDRVSQKKIALSPTGSIFDPNRISMLGFPIKGYLQIMQNYIDLLYPFMTISKPWFWGTPILGNLQWILSIHCKDSPKIGVQTAETVTIGGCGECLAPVAVQNKEHVQLHWAVINRSMSILVDGTYTNIITKSSWSITMVLINQQWQPNTTGRAAHCREFYTCFFFCLIRTPTNQPAQDGRVLKAAWCR